MRILGLSGMTRGILVIGLAWLLALGTRAPAAAHAYGPFSISVYSGLSIGADEINIRWVLDMAEVPASATVELIDTNDDGVVIAAEKTAYFDIWVSSVLEGIKIEVDGRTLSKTVGFRELSLPAGEGGSPALRVVMDITVELQGDVSGEVHRAVYRDTNYTEFVGWREVAVAAGQAARLLTSSVPATGRTNELTVYPADLGMSVPTSEADFTFSLGDQGVSKDLQSVNPPAAAASAEQTSFHVWPTGVLAIFAVTFMAAVLIAANRDEPKRRRPRR